MLPLPLHLPTLHSVVAAIISNYYIGKSDWRHGFYHLVLGPRSRSLMGIRLHNGHIARYKAAGFGPSQCPALFTYVSNEFAFLLHLEFLRHNISTVVIITYVDDVLLAAPNFSTL